MIFLSGCIATIIFLFIIVLCQLLLENRETKIRQRIVRENLAYIDAESRRLANEKTKLMERILSDPLMRQLYFDIDKVIDGLVKKQNIKIEIPAGTSLEVAHAILNTLLISMHIHITESKELEKSLENLRDSEGPRSSNG